MSDSTLSQTAEETKETSSFHLSHSRIAKYLTCPEQYRLHYLVGLRPRIPSANLAFGSVLHEAIAALFRDGEDPVDQFGKRWDTLREIELDFSRKDTWESLKESAIRILRRFQEEAVPRISNVSAVERPFELEITTLQAKFLGVVDLVAEVDHVKTVVDWKSTMAAYGEHEVILSDQLSSYQLAEPDARQVAFCVLVKTKESRITWQVSSRTPEQLTEYLDKLRLVATAIASSQFYKRPGMWCSWCEFLPVCVGNQKRATETLIQVR